MHGSRRVIDQCFQSENPPKAVLVWFQKTKSSAYVWILLRNEDDWKRLLDQVSDHSRVIAYLQTKVLAHTMPTPGDLVDLWMTQRWSFLVGMEDKDNLIRLDPGKLNEVVQSFGWLERPIWVVDSPFDRGAETSKPMEILI